MSLSPPSEEKWKELLERVKDLEISVYTDDILELKAEQTRLKEDIRNLRRLVLERK